MNCEKCHGTGFIPIWEDGLDILVRYPCEECGGTGKSHCCDGLKEQPEGEE